MIAKTTKLVSSEDVLEKLREVIVLPEKIKSVTIALNIDEPVIIDSTFYALPIKEEEDVE
jgi:hypothetical protein